MKKVEIWMLETSQPIKIQALNSYTKGMLYCVLVECDGEKKVNKYPMCNIFRIVEDY